MSVDYQQFNLKLANFQEQHLDINVQEELETRVNTIIETTSVSEENYINLFDKELSNLIIEIEGANGNNTVKNEQVKSAKKGTLPIDKVPTKSSNKITTRSKEIRLPLITLASTSPNFIMPCTNIDTNFYFILETPYDKIGYVGIWYITSKSMYKLISSKLKVLRVIVTSVNSKDKRYSYELEITSNKGATEQFVLTSFELERGKLKSVLAKYSDRYPTTKYLEGLLIDAIQILASQENVLIQVEEETLGYHTLPTNERVYLLTNGIETVNGFIPSDKSPLIAPSIPDTANGYKGKNVCTVNDEILKELFCNLNANEEVQTIMLALLGASCIVSYPIGDYAGTLPFAIEIIGNNGVGKTPLVNYMLSFFGIDFDYDKATLFGNSLSEGDTSKARGKRLSKLPYMMFADSDNQDTPNIGKKFETTYAMRNKTNVAIANRDGRSSLSITREERYDEPVNGSLIRTSNFDFALISIERDNTPTEKRTCTFIWPIGAYSQENISMFIDERREEYYAIGASYRNWCMKKSDSELLQLFSQIKKIVNIDVNKYEWSNDTAYKKQTIAFLIGLHLFMEFLKEVLSTSFMLLWLTEHIPVLIQNRIARTKYIFGDIKKQVEENEVQEILTAIAMLFANGDMHVTNQQNKLYGKTLNDIPYVGLENLGLRYLNGNERTIQTSKLHVGHTVDNDMVYAFIPKRLYEALHKYGKQHGKDFVSLAHVEEVLKTHDIMLLDNQGNKPRHLIGKSQLRYIDIPMSKIFPEIEREENEKPSNVTDFDEKRKMLNMVGETKEIDVDSTETF